jgi:hypothetical protein
MREKEMNSTGNEKIIITGALALLFGATVIAIWYYRKDQQRNVVDERDLNNKTSDGSYLPSSAVSVESLVSRNEVATCGNNQQVAPLGVAPLPSLALAFELYNASCICGETLSNNCAHFLSDALLRSGYKIDNGCGIAKYDRCKSGRPVRAKELRLWAEFMVNQKKGEKRVSHDAKHGHKTAISSGFWFVYQERKSDHQGHVCLHHETSEKKYSWCGTGDYENWEVQWHYRF